MGAERACCWGSSSPPSHRFLLLLSSPLLRQNSNGRERPYEVLLDGANIALFGQNWEGGGFSAAQVKAMWDHAAAAFPGRRALLVLHQNRVRELKAVAPALAPWLEALRARRELFATPPGSNDDWYWMYAAVKARGRGVLVSNDELRDHIWAMLRPRHFLRWKVRHIARYSFPRGSAAGVTLQAPAPYTPCAQQLPESGAWMLPAAERPGEWLMIAPAAAE